MQQVVLQQTVLEQIATVSSVIASLAVAAFAVVGIVIAWRFRGSYKKLNALLDRAQTELKPLVDNATRISEDVKQISHSVRDDVQKVSDTVNDANERLHEAIEATEARVKEFNGLLEVVQQEAEDAFVSTAATVRGIRSGVAAFDTDATAFDDRGGPDFASDELDPAEVADEIERQIESQEVGDGYNGSAPAQPSAETLSAAPRIRPRARGQRRSG